MEITMHIPKMEKENLNFKDKKKKNKYSAKGNKSKEVSTIEFSTLIQLIFSLVNRFR